MCRRILTLIVLAGLAGATAVRAQGPGGTAPVRTFTNKSQFRLPFQLTAAERSRLREVQLHVKVGNDSWSVKDVAPPTQGAFVFKTVQDGEYWFSIVTVDRSGILSPTDPAREEPSLVVIVDTTPPEINLFSPGAGQPGAPPSPYLGCHVRDLNADPSKNRVEYQVSDRSWRTCEPVPGHPILFQRPDERTWTGAVRATATDLAGNTVTREMNLRTGTPIQPASATTSGERTDVVTEKVPAPLPQGIERGAVPTRSVPMAPVAITSVTGMGNGGQRPVPPPLPGPALGNPPVEERGSALGSATSPTPAAPRPSTIFLGGAAERPSGILRQIVNSPRTLLDYRIDQVGPSGVGQVEVWMTRNDGKNWQKLCEDAKKRSPVEVDLPGEGIYGLAVVVKNGLGLGDPPPAAGTVPEYMVEVDATRPTAQLLTCRPAGGEGAPVVNVSWIASDKNLGPDPVDIYYAATKEGPWQVLARGVPNNGSYRWPVTPEAGNEFFVLLTVTDRAGNTTRCELQQSVVMDTTRPKSRILGVSPAGGSRAMNGPTGN